MGPQVHTDAATDEADCQRELRQLQLTLALEQRGMGMGIGVEEGGAMWAVLRSMRTVYCALSWEDFLSQCYMPPVFGSGSEISFVYPASAPAPASSSSQLPSPMGMAMGSAVGIDTGVSYMRYWQLEWKSNK